jgi:indole-3-glycerol phosphate synthase/phosphoribosylanthranilate isomerase
MREPEGALGEIVARKKIDVAARLGRATLGELGARAEPAVRSLAAALAAPGARFIMEVKKASPSAGELSSVDPADQAAAYVGAANAVSVLTDGPFFGGALADIAAVRRVFDGPILAKDFIVDPRQVAEARLHGADAVLVLLSVLDDEEARVVMQAAARLGMDALVEAHDEVEVARAVALGARIVGINNRDLRSLTVDLSVTERLAPLVPADRLVVAESGIARRADVERLAPHADAFLVGTSLMRTKRPAQAARTLAFGRVKVCGVSGSEDAMLAARTGGCFIGIVMVPDSPRAVAPGAAEPIADAARRQGAGVVGVFRDAPLQHVADAAHWLGLRAVQLHGNETADYIRALRPMLPVGVEIWAARPVGMAVSAPRAGADRSLFDTKVGARTGGTGIAFDWSRVAYRRDLGTSLLAGGLNPANAAAAARVGAWALDIASGVEVAPGRKDPAKLDAFFDALRVPARSDAMPC